jgi:hypothetical protein
MGRVLLALFLLGTLAVVAAAEPPSRKAAEDDIREVVLRYLLNYGIRHTDNPPQQPPSPGTPPPTERRRYKVLFVSVEQKDPSEKFLRRFRDLSVPLKRGSLAQDPGPRATYRTPSGWKDRETGALGLRYSLGRILWRGEDKAEIPASWNSGTKSGMVATFVVERKEKRWRVVRIGERVKY